MENNQTKEGNIKIPKYVTRFIAASSLHSTKISLF